MNRYYIQIIDHTERIICNIDRAIIADSYRFNTYGHIEFLKADDNHSFINKVIASFPANSTMIYKIEKVEQITN